MQGPVVQSASELSRFENPMFAIKDQAIHLTFVPVFQNKIRLDHPDPDTHFFRLSVFQIGIYFTM